MEIGKRSLGNEIRVLSSSTNLPRGRGQVIDHLWVSVSHGQREQVPSAPGILILNSIPFCSQARKKSGVHKLSTKLIDSKVWKIYQPIIILPVSSNLFISVLFLTQLLHSSLLWKAALVKLLERFLLAQFLVQIEFRILILLFICLQIIGEPEHYILWEASFSHLIFL